MRAAPSTESRSPRLEAGLTENRFFVRTLGNGLVLFPGGVLNVDGRSFRTGNLDAPNDGVSVARARPELAGRLGGVVGFNAAIDVAHGPSLRGVDNYVSVAPWNDRVILQAGRFDAPFTMENRISDRGLDFLERSTVARTFGIPENKKLGAMVHGTNTARNYYYSAGGFLGDGQTDGIGRAWIAPFSFGRGPELLRAVTVGGSAWRGQAKSGAAVAPQTTQSGFLLLDPTTKWFDGTDETDVALRTSGSLTAAAVELNAPFRHKVGVRFEFATKRQSLAVQSIQNGAAPVSHGGLELDGWASYGEVWYWPVGDDRVVGEQGLQLPTRLGTTGLQRPLTGVMLAARLERLDEDLYAGSDPTIAADVVSARGTKLTTLTLGANVWFARRLRATFNYALNHPSGNALFVTRLTDTNIHELTLRFALAL